MKKPRNYCRICGKPSAKAYHDGCYRRAHRSASAIAANGRALEVENSRGEEIIDVEGLRTGEFRPPG